MSTKLPITPSSSSSNISTGNVLLASSSQNLSSHSAPPPATNNAGYTAKKGNNKKRESKGQLKQKQQIQQASKVQSHLYQDELDLDIDDQISGKLKGKGRRGQISINHLLDFGLPPRDLTDNIYNKPIPRRPRRRSSNTERVSLTGPEFTNANYRFVVDGRLPYKGQILDPNLVLPDLTILRIIAPKGHNCPICLSDDIIAPRMSSCGHIFCHSCLLSFMDSQPIVKKGYAPTKYRECPLCSSFVKPHEIKPVLFNNTDERFEVPKVGQDVVMKLMARPHGSILPLPHGLNLNHKKIDNIPWYLDSEVNPYARILKGGLKFVVDNYEREKLEILTQFEEDKLLYGDSENNSKYIDQAIEEIDAQIIDFKENFKDNYDEPNLSLDGLSLKNNQEELNDTNCFFFYQTSFNSTTRYFLSSLDTRIIFRTYGSYSNFPATLLLNVENINWGLVVTEPLLKKFKFMNHLPLGTEIATLEINWSSIRLPNEVFQEFRKELVERQRKAKIKTKREDIAKKNYDNFQELKTIEFYRSEGSLAETHEGHVFYDDIPPINVDNVTPNSDDSDSNTEKVSTVWGTKIPIRADGMPTRHDKELAEDLNFDEMIKKVKESGGESEPSAGKKKKGKKKKLVLMTSTGRGAY